MYRGPEDKEQFPPQTHKSDGLQARIVLQLRMGRRKVEARELLEYNFLKDRQDRI